MKAIHHIILTTTVLLLMKAVPAEAILYLTGDSTFGPNSITVDTSTGLGWLNLGEAAGLSYDQVFSEMGAGGTFSGFRFATAQEVLDLFSSAGISGPGYYALSTPSISSLFSLIGTTENSGQPGAIALSGTISGPAGTYCAPAIYPYGVNGVEEYWVNDGGFQSGGTAFGPSTSYPDLSSWLVMAVPEPGDAGLLGLAAAVWCAFRCLPRRKTAA